MSRTNLEVFSRTAIILLIGFLFFFLIYSMTNYGDSYTDKQAANIEKIIDKALVQCYALEGEYPAEIERIEKYGVALDKDKFVYFYEWHGGNLKPDISVFEK